MTVAAAAETEQDVEPPPAAETEKDVEKPTVPFPMVHFAVGCDLCGVSLYSCISVFMSSRFPLAFPTAPICRADVPHYRITLHVYRLHGEGRLRPLRGLLQGAACRTGPVQPAAHPGSLLPTGRLNDRFWCGGRGKRPIPEPRPGQRTLTPPPSESA